MSRFGQAYRLHLGILLGISIDAHYDAAKFALLRDEGAGKAGCR